MQIVGIEQQQQNNNKKSLGKKRKKEIMANNAQKRNVNMIYMMELYTFL